MKSLIIIICFFVNLITYDGASVPEGFALTGTWEVNGVLSFVDEHGNGLDIYKEDNVDLNARDVLIERTDPASIIDPIDTIITLKGDAFTVKAYFLKLGDPSTHEEFERKAMKLLRQVAQGGQDGKENSFRSGSFRGADFCRPAS